MTMSADFGDAMPEQYRREIPIAVQIISTLLYGGFAITSVAIAFGHSWPAAVVLAIILGWRGGFGPPNFTQTNTAEIVAQVRALSPEATQRRGGNASFDAYREDVLRRLEDEQENFDNFLGRLRDAKDKSEFDEFMDDRARKAQVLD